MDNTIFRIEAPLSLLNRQELQYHGQDLWNAEIEFMHDDGYIDQHLDLGIGAELLAILLETIGLIAVYRDHRKSRIPTLEAIERSVRRAAQTSLGADELQNLTYRDLPEFLEGRSDKCQITAEINDELYVFHVSRDGSIVIIRYDA